MSRPTRTAYTSQGYGEGSVTEIPVERRVSERRRVIDLMHALKRSIAGQQVERRQSERRRTGETP